MIRGEIWSASGASDYAGKPRPWLVVQSEQWEIEASVILCGFTTALTEGSHLRPLIQPTKENGLNTASRVMVDKVSTVAYSKLGKRIGQLAREDLLRVEQALALVLGFAG